MSAIRIAIIGGGVSGLSAAYELAQAAKNKKQKMDITIYEKNSALGGNANTVAFSLGYKKGVPSSDNNINYIRWADLGVNDINLTVYKNVRQVMKTIGYLDDENQNLLPLENTECYFTLDGKTTLTGDADLQQGVVDHRYSLQHVESGYLEKFIELLNEAAIKAIYPNGQEAEEDLEITCSDFFNACAWRPKEKLEAFAKTKKWYKESDWNDEDWIKKAKSWVRQLRDHVFYARISAMYFTNDAGPEKMLLAAPFKYYMLQEGITAGESDEEKEAADRRYFVGGSQRWLEYLADYLTKTLSADSDNINISLVEGEASLTAKKDGVDVATKNYMASFDYGVVTTHANDALRLLDFQQAEARQQAEVESILSSISYTTSVAVCHNWSGVLPPNRNTWRTYNVLIRQGACLKPYSMTYVCNRHQNDVNDPNYNLSGLPQFFVTLNPQVPIPDESVLRKVPKSLIPDDVLRVLPKETINNIDRTELGGDRAIAYFNHNLIDKPCFLAQRALVDYHASLPRLYFGGGWSHGSGLHEECWLQAKRIASHVFKHIESA